MAAKTWTGEWWKRGGGGTAWNGITYDPELNRIYIGTGNGQPHSGHSAARAAATTSSCARSSRSMPTRGSISGTTRPIPAIRGTTTPIWTSPPRHSTSRASRCGPVARPKNGFLYVIDRHNGQLISADKIDFVNWAQRIDLKSGQPSRTRRCARSKDEVWPSATGAHSVMAQSYSPSASCSTFPVIRSGSSSGPRIKRSISLIAIRRASRRLILSRRKKSGRSRRRILERRTHGRRR